MDAGHLVVLHLAEPTEKFWGVLVRLAAEGATVRGVSLDSFDDWMRGVARREPELDLSTMFVPLSRVVRIFLDEQVGAVESYRQRFERTVGVSVEQYLSLSLDGGSDSPLPS